MFENVLFNPFLLLIVLSSQINHSQILYSPTNLIKSGIFFPCGLLTPFVFNLSVRVARELVGASQKNVLWNEVTLYKVSVSVKQWSSWTALQLPTLETIPILRQHIYGLILTHPPTHYVSINTVLNLSKNGQFSTPPTQFFC